MADIPKLQPGILQGMHYNTQEWLRQSTDSINARFALVLDTQTANLIYAGPSSGAAAIPSFRNIVPADFGTQTANRVMAGPTSGGVANPTLRALVAADIPVISAASVPVISYSSLPIQSYHASFTGTQVTNQVALTVTNSGMYLLNTYVQWTAVGIGAGLAYTQKWNDGVVTQTDSTLSISNSDNTPSRVTQFAKLGAATNITFTTTQSANPTFGTYEVYVIILQIG